MRETETKAVFCKPVRKLIKRLKVVIYLLMGSPSQSYGASPAVWDHTALPATRHRSTHPALTLAR